MAHQDRHLVSLTRPECLELVRSATVGRVVFSERALPAVLPASYGMLDEDVVICTESTGHLARAARGSVLAFEVDEIDPHTRTGWSVVLTGMPAIVTDPDERARAVAAMDPWLPQRADLVVRIPSTLISGRRVVADRPLPVEAAG